MIKKNCGIIVCLILLVFYSLGYGKKTFQTNSTFSESGEIIVNFDNMEIKDLAKFISQTFNVNVILDPRLRGRITIISSKPVSKEVFWEMLSEAISLSGGIIYKEKGMIKIYSQRRYREETPKIGKFPEKALGEPYVLVYVCSKLNPGRVSRVIRPLLSPRAFITVIPDTPVMIIKDYGDNLVKIKQFLDLIEKEKILPEFKIFKLKYAYVEDIYREIVPILQNIAKERGIPFRIARDKRTNVLIVYGDKEIFKETEDLLKSLDLPVREEKRGFWVIPVKFVSAENIVKVLKSLNLRNFIKKDKRMISQGMLSIGADRTTNSIIVYASPEEYEEIKKLVSELDRRQKQVLLATMVVEVSLSKIKNWGIHWQALGKYGGFSFGGLSDVDIYSAVRQGNLIAGVFSSKGHIFSLGGTNVFFPDLLFLFSLIEDSSGFNIISNPKILTINNKKAVIKVGESVPYTTGITYQNNNLPTVSFDYRDVGLSLTITPHISGNTVRLEIEQSTQEVTQVYRASQGVVDFVAPVTSKREIKSEVVVDNGQTIILGGLISKKNKNSNTGIPWLSSIPILGYLFKNSRVEKQETTLFIFITPYIISSPEELKRITEEHELMAKDLKILLDFYKKKEKK